MTEIQVYDFQEHPVRILGSWDKPLFCLVDVCRVLNLGNPSEVAKRLEPDELTSEKLRSGGQDREFIFVNEPGFYRTIFRSNKEEALAFQRWEFNEVLPAIRKTGGYQSEALRRLSHENRLLKTKYRALRQGVPDQALTLGSVARMYGLSVEELVFVLAENSAMQAIKKFARIGEYQRILKADLPAIEQMVAEHRLLNADGIQIDLFNPDVCPTGAEAYATD